MTNPTPFDRFPPKYVRRYALGLTPQFVPWGCSRTLEAATQVDGSFVRLVVPSSIAPHFLVTQIRVSGVPMFAGSTSVPAVALSEMAMDGLEIREALKAGATIEVDVRNVSKRAPLLVRLAARALARWFRPIADMQMGDGVQFYATAFLDVLSDAPVRDFNADDDDDDAPDSERGLAMFFRLDGRDVEPCTCLEWAQWFEAHVRDDARIVGFDQVGPCKVSTVFVGTDLQPWESKDGEGRPFETAVFVVDKHGPQMIALRKQSATWEEAEVTHQASVVEARAILSAMERLS